MFKVARACFLFAHVKHGYPTQFSGTCLVRFPELQTHGNWKHPLKVLKERRLPSCITKMPVIEIDLQKKLTGGLHDQAFENTSTSVAASQMRNALNNLSDTVTDPKEKQVRASSCWTIHECDTNSVCRGLRRRWITFSPSSAGISTTRPKALSWTGLASPRPSQNRLWTTTASGTPTLWSS